jgi:hypothetical protein
MAGAWSTNSRAGWDEELPKVWAVPRGTRTKSSGPRLRSRPSRVTVTVPSRTKYASEQVRCRWAGGPAGGVLEAGVIAPSVRNPRRSDRRSP